MNRLRSTKGLGLVVEVLELYFSKNLSRAASSLAYFLILTFFPVLICIHAFVGLLDLNPTTLLEPLAGIIPTDAMSIIASYIGYLSENQSAAILVAGLAATLVSASAALRQLTAVMSELYERPRRGSPLRFLRSFVFSLLLLLMIYASIYVMFTSSRFFRDLLAYWHLPNPIASLEHATYWLFAALILLFILLVYRVTLPSGKPRPPVVPGAVAAAGLLVASSLVFSAMISRSGRYSFLYGTLSSAIILLVWLYLCGTVIILGNVLNCVLHRRRQSKSDE